MIGSGLAGCPGKKIDDSWEAYMPIYEAEIRVELKKGILDPQGQAICNALAALGFSGIREIRSGKVLHITFEAGDKQQAEATIKSASDRLLANPVIEDYSYRIKLSKDGAVR